MSGVDRAGVSGPGSERIRVLVADDHALVRAGIVMMLSAHDDIQVVAEAADGRQAVALARTCAPDLVVLDLRMPGLDGLGVLAELLGDPELGDDDHLVRVLVLTTFDDDESVTGALRAGASGFLVKESAPQHLIDAVRVTSAGGSWLDPAIAETVIRRLRSAPTPDESAREMVERLTPREREVLGLVGRGLTNAQIRDQLVLSEATVKTHVSRILMKTASGDRAQAVALAYRSGLVVP